MEVHHVGYLVKNIKKTMPSFEVLGYELTSDVVWDESRKANICFLTNGGYCVELIEPASDSDIYPLLKKYKNSPYHICYKCDDIEAAIEELKDAKYMLFQEPAKAPAISEKATVAFLMSPRAGMIELVEEK